MQRVEEYSRSCIHSRNLVTLVDDIDNQVEDSFLKNHINHCDVCKEKLLDEMSFRERVSKSIPFQSIPSDIQANLDNEINEITSALDSHISSIKLGRRREGVQSFFQFCIDVKNSLFNKKILAVATVSVLVSLCIKFFS